MLPSELIADEKNWTKGTSARNEKGDPVASESKDAFSFCMFEAIVQCNPEISYESLCEIGEKLGIQITVFNDDYETTHADVIAALKSVGL